MSFYTPNPSPYGGSHTGYGNYGNDATMQQPYEHSWGASHNGYAGPHDQYYSQYNQQSHQLHIDKQFSALHDPSSVSAYEAAMSSMRPNSNTHVAVEATSNSVRKIMPAPPAIKYAAESRLDYAGYSQEVGTSGHPYSFTERDGVSHYSSANYFRPEDHPSYPERDSESWLGTSYNSQQPPRQAPPSQHYHGFSPNGFEDSWYSNAPRPETHAIWGHVNSFAYPRPPPPIVRSNPYNAYPAARSDYPSQPTRFDTANKPNYNRNTSGNRGFNHANKRGQSNYSGRGCGNNWRQTPSSSNSDKSFLSGANSAALTPPDFEKLELPDVKKDFYTENDHLADRDSDEIDDFMEEFNISLSGRYQPRPCMSFEDIDLPEEIQNVINSKNFEKPTPIQAQTWPIALSGDNMVGIAQTGSGKTCAFVIPGLIHILNNKEVVREPNNPLMLVLCPTRELSQQVAQVTEEFANAVGLNTVCVYGGVPRNEQAFELEKKNPEILVATPGRLIDFMETKQVSVKMVSYLVLDEADRMLDMGFEQQIRTIITNIRPQRQTLMFSATWPDEVWQLAKDFLDSYTKVNVGSQKLSANHQITQVIECCEEEEKPGKILELLKTLTENDQTLRTLIFCDTKKAVNELHKSLNESNYKAECIHGNKKQTDREFVLKQFAENKVPILIATDVAARGLDISDIKHVINYDYPNNSEDYVHRIGRTARGATTGVAYTFFTQNNMGQSGKLISILEEADQEVPTMLKFYANFVKQR